MILKVGIVGISGYSGVVALEQLLKHPFVRVTYVAATSSKGKVSDLWPHLKGITNLKCQKYNFQEAQKNCDVIFLAVPHTSSMLIAPQLLKAGIRVIDLSGDYRLSNPTIYKKWYGVAHKDKANLNKAVYGLPELYREDIKKAHLIANPGCYPTAALLGLAPIVSSHTEDIDTIIIDAKSGVTGAGRKVVTNFLFAEVNENFKAYRVLNHQHTPEINLYLSKISRNAKINVNFVPHLLPINRGILETIYIKTRSKMNANKVHGLYKKFYKTEKFVRLLPVGEQVEIKNVVKTNYCDLSIAADPSQNLIVVTSVIDNLMKGAAGQAIQNMNIMHDINEQEGLS